MDDDEIRRLTERIRGAGALAPDRTDDVIPMLTEVVMPSTPGAAGTTLPQGEAPPAAAELSGERFGEGFNEIADDAVGEAGKPVEDAVEGEAFDAEARAAFEARVVESVLERLRDALEPAVRDAVRAAVDDALRESAAEPPGPL